jgi:hypothetical protein
VLQKSLVSRASPVSAALATMNGVTLTAVCEFETVRLKVTTDAVVFGTIEKAADGTVVPFEDDLTGFHTYSDPHPLPVNQPPPGESSFVMSFTVRGAGHFDVRMDYQRFDTAGQCQFDGVAVPTS